MTSPDPYVHLAGVYDELVVDPCHSSWADYLADLWTDDEVHTVLDVCCGSGLMTEELVRRGYSVTGLDASDAMLARARRRLGPKVRLVHAVLPDLGDLDAVRPGSTFDAAVSTLDGLNYLGLPQLHDTMLALSDLLRPGGWLVFDVHAEGTIPFLLEHAEIRGTHGDATYTLSTTIDTTTRRCSSVLDLQSPDPGSSFVEEHVQYIHRAEEIRAVLEAAGFRIAAEVDEYSDSPVRVDTLRTTWIARRPAP